MIFCMKREREEMHLKKRTKGLKTDARVRFIRQHRLRNEALKSVWDLQI